MTALGAARTVRTFGPCASPLWRCRPGIRAAPGQDRPDVTWRAWNLYRHGHVIGRAGHHLNTVITDLDALAARHSRTSAAGIYDTIARGDEGIARDRVTIVLLRRLEESDRFAELSPE
ncbi:MAG TPA: hypothetical protein HA263_01435 [Methanoregulaceae archaeon]|nr:hypothetical protein [Methanoregulaceae archaeon]